MLADASGKNVLIADTIEASSLGAAMIAAHGADGLKVFQSLPKT